MGPTTQRGWIYNRLESWLNSPQERDEPALAFMGKWTRSRGDTDVSERAFPVVVAPPSWLRDGR